MDFSFLTSNRYVMIGLIVLIFIVVGYYVYSNFINQKKSTITDDIFNDEENTKSKYAEIMLFHVDWCPHCKTALPEWDKVKKEYNNKVVNGYEVLFMEYNCTEETDEITKKIDAYKVEGFPTIKLKVNGTVVEFDAKVNKDNMEKFLSTVLSQ
jgi:thiol-disulfide isomerase/thioredoxin